MRIDIYTLLGLVKDGKEPKKIKYRDKIWEYTTTVKGKSYQYYSPFYQEWKTLQSHVYLEECLNEEVEIIEEPKKIEKLNDKLGLFGDGNTQKIINELNYTRTIINELIDEINNLKGKKL